MVKSLDARTLAAVDWMLRLDPERASAEDCQAFEVWLRADPGNRSAWQRVSGLLDEPLAVLQAGAGHPAQRAAALDSLLQPAEASRRRFVGGLSALLVTGGLAAAVTHRISPLDGLLADLHTGTGERRSVQLADGSLLDLNARTQVDLSWSATRRWLRLLDGQIRLQLQDSLPVPLQLELQQGQVQMSGGSVQVHAGPEQALVTVQAPARVRNRTGMQVELQPGQSVWVQRTQILPARETLHMRSDWTQGWLNVENAPLEQVIAALRDYTPGVLSIAPAAASVRVFGVFSLDDVEATLKALEETLPIRIRRFSRWLVRIEVA